MKKILNITLWITGIAGLSILVSFIESEHRKTTCKSLEVTIDYRDADPLIDSEEMNQIVYNAFDSLVGKKLTDINSANIENYISEIDYVETAQVYSTLTGKMKINIVQRDPLVRVINRSFNNYYIDTKGKLMPVKDGFASRVLIANGYIFENYSDTLDASKIGHSLNLHHLYTLAGFIKNDEFLNAQIEQIFVTNTGDFELVPKVGRHLIIFGDIYNMENKFSKLKVFYNEGINKKGWDLYKTINLKYENQVVCEKK